MLRATALVGVQVELTEHFTLNSSVEQALAYIEAERNLGPLQYLEAEEIDVCADPDVVCSEPNEDGVVFVDPAPASGLTTK